MLQGSTRGNAIPGGGEGGGEGDEREKKNKNILWIFLK
jgi:hypothetical protein